MKRHTATLALVVVGVLGAASMAGAQGTLRENLPQTIPLFPLQDVMLFPEMSRPLHIFEPRYRDMVTDAVQGDGVIGMVLLRPGYESLYEGNPPIFQVGCAGEIAEAEELDDGRWLIVLRGTTRFRVLNEDHTRTYRTAEVEALGESLDSNGEQALGVLRPALAELFESLTPSGEAPANDLSNEDLVNVLSQFLTLDPADRQRLLEADGPLARAEALLEITRQVAPADL